MSTWTYGVVCEHNKTLGTSAYTIRELYLDAKGNIEGISSDASPFGETKEELIVDLAMMLEAVKQGLIYQYEDIIKEIQK